MDLGALDLLRHSLLQIASERFADKPTLHALCRLDVDAYCDAFQASIKLQSGEITSYSIAGRSVTKRDVGAIDLEGLYDRLSRWFTTDELPESGAANTVGYDFGGGKA